MDTAYARRYGQLYARHWWWRAREAYLVAQLRRLRPPQGWRRILDVGCGDGLFFPRLRELGDVVAGVGAYLLTVDKKKPPTNSGE